MGQRDSKESSKAQQSEYTHSTSVYYTHTCRDLLTQDRSSCQADERMGYFDIKEPSKMFSTPV